MMGRALRGVLLAGVIAVAGADAAQARAGAGPKPPAWQDLATQAFEIAYSTHPYLDSVDAALRDVSNGTTAGYVYSLTSDTFQLGLTVKRLIADTRKLATEVTQGHIQASRAVRGYNAIRDYYKDFRDRYNSTRCQVTGTVAGTTTTDPVCIHDEAMVIYFWEATSGSAPNTQPTAADRARPGFPSGSADAVSATSTAAHFDYGQAITELGTVAEDGAELLLQVRNTVGDAHDYVSNKEVGLLIAALDESKVAKVMGRLATKLTGLKSHLRAERRQMAEVWKRDYLLSGLAGVGYPPSPPVPPVIRPR